MRCLLASKFILYLVLSPPQDKGSHHPLRSRDTFLSEESDLGVTFGLEDGAKGLQTPCELVGENEVHQRLLIEFQYRAKI
jgi:hypothetical protein